MRTGFEIIKPDEGSAFRLLYQNVKADTYKWDYHYHPELELVYVFSGTGRRHVGDHLSDFIDGDLVLIGSNLPHSGFGFGALGDHEEIVIQFKDDFLGSLFTTSPEMSFIKNLFEHSKRGIVYTGETKEFVGQKLKEMRLLEPYDRLLTLLNIFKALAFSKDSTFLNNHFYSYDFSHKDEIRLKKIYQYVESNYQKPINIHEVAEVASLSVPAFCSYFKKVINLTFTDFVNQYRINVACKHLSKKQSIADTCFASGFNNVSYFGKVFKELKGETPNQYQRNILRK